jgi:hypothetical protein
MDGCSLFALIACFNWSGLYIDAGVEYYDAPLRSSLTHETLYRYDGRNYSYGGATDAIDHYGTKYGYAALGYEFGGERLSFNLRLTHNSSFATSKDPGMNAISFGFRWRPFAR